MSARTMFFLFLLGGLSGEVGCGGESGGEGDGDADADSDADGDADSPVDLTGVYSCTIEVVDNDVDCGGPVYLTRLEGQALPWNVTHQDRTLTIGAWGVVLDGRVATGDFIDAEYREVDCEECADGDFVIDLDGDGVQNAISDIHVDMFESGLDGIEDCRKTYRGNCARN